MVTKYLDAVSIPINQILFNISFIAAFYGTGYSVMSRPISALGNTKKVKKCLKLELINLVLNIFLVAMNFIAEVKHQGIAQIGVIWQYFWTQIAFNVLLILLAALFFTYLFVRTKQNIYSGVEIDSKYIDFTKAVGTNREVFIIAGDFGFLGRVPKKTVKNFDQCAAALKKLLETNRPECSGDSNSDQCKNCIFKKEQFKQLVDKVKNKSVKLKILCRRPHADEEEYKITIGYFMELFPRMEIKFYTNPDGKCPDLPLRGRIIETAQNSKKMFSHFVLEPNQYQEMAVCDTNSSEGRTYIGVYLALWHAATDPTISGQLKGFKTLYKTYISKAEQLKQDHDCSD